MDKKIAGITVIWLVCFGCVTGIPQEAYQAKKGALGENVASETSQNDMSIDPLYIDPGALPRLQDLPVVPPIPPARKYTGIIKNKTKYEVSIPSRNSDATITIPPYGWVEYTAWNKHFSMTVYNDGNPFFCININAHFQKYPFMCKKYDFIAEIVKEEPVIRKGPSKLKRRKIKSRV